MFWYYFKFVLDIFTSFFAIPLFEVNLSNGQTFSLTLGYLVVGFLILFAIFRGFFSHVK